MNPWEEAAAEQASALNASTNKAPKMPWEEAAAEQASANNMATNAPVQQPISVTPSNPTDGNSFFQNMLVGAGKGLTDIGLGAKQRLDEAAAYLENKFGGQGVNKALGMPNASDILANTQQQAIQKAQTDAAIMATGGGKVGNFIGTAVPMAAASLIPGANGLVGSGITGAAMGALQPTQPDQSVLGNAGIGALGGIAGYGIGKGVGRILNPQAALNPDLNILKAAGVKPTIGQTLGGVFNKNEQKMQSVPIAGDMISSAREGAKEQFNNAFINRSTNPIGVNIEGVGQDAVRKAGNALSDYYENSLSNLQPIQIDHRFMNGLVAIHANAQNMSDPLVNKFNNVINNTFVKKLSANGTISGDDYKLIDSELGKVASKFGSSQSNLEQELATHVNYVKDLLKKQMMQSNPEVAAQLQKADEGWANLVRVEGAAKLAKNTGGVFTPGQALSAVQAADDSIRKRAVARGTSYMQDLASAGQNVLGSSVADSGTVGRGLLGAVAMGMHPPILGYLAAGAGLYTKPVQSLLNGLASARTPAMQQAGQIISNNSRILAPAIPAITNQMFSPNTTNPYSNMGIFGQNTNQ